MARAKHRDKIAQREHEAFVKRVQREDAQTEMRKAHKEFKRNFKQAQKAVRENDVEALANILDEGAVELAKQHAKRVKSLS